MSELKDAKTWGGIGSILTIFGLGFIGFILKLIGIKKISEATGNEEIYNKYLWAAILAVIGLLLPLPGLLSGSIAGFGLMGVLAAILMIVSVYFMKQSYDMIAEETGVAMFKTAALLYIIGAVLMIIVIGILLIFVAAILETVAFFSLPDELPGKKGQTPAEEEVVF
ncbi:hypothetical protein A3L09_07910 [Thermococcus profundus]|uniref:DUF996 domain-containing protein n=1 Tax=Thermococcus profundus TaxID=49899 RepID=A0A2Z2MEN1_THEPR|nr:DUF996 domain-containing protein [Thermococcus profundus]ASJ03182.1 hypothetical protein A3L09_07910 [Thermococcus profundus]